MQLCNLEAMDQIEAWQDELPAGHGWLPMRGRTIRIERRHDGRRRRAFRSRDRWYDIRFRCEVAPDHAKVVAFEFEVGDPVPRKDWEDLNLPAVH